MDCLDHLSRAQQTAARAARRSMDDDSVDQVLETGALRSLYPQDVLEAARRMDRQRREHEERYARDS